MRIDKFLKVSRVIKRRTVANEACDAGRVSVNGRPAKASVRVKSGDIVEIGFAGGVVKFEVLAIKETVKKDEAACMYRIIEEVGNEE
ncbi:MAG: RNA-binding S4 domain-containing protein [Ruminococcaceae bacterium]|nr:RNA-binding S4 domain-containing protein [Oscillospiraceae bacterium]